MKKISISKKVWKQLYKIKNERNLSSLSKTVEYLINSQHVLKGEKPQKKIDPVSLKKNSGFIEEKKALNDIYAFLDGKKDE